MSIRSLQLNSNHSYGGDDKMPKQSKFDKLQNSVAKSYEKKGMSAKQAQEIGGSVAYDQGVKKFGKAGMAKKAAKGRKK